MSEVLAPWHWRSLPLGGRSGSEVFEALFRPRDHQAIAVLLESPIAADPSQRNPHARYSLCGGPPREVLGQAQVWVPPVGRILPTLREQFCRAPLDLELSPAIAALPFTGGWLGWLGYDLAWEIERLPSLNPDPLPFPVAFWYVPESFAVLDHWEDTLWLAASDPAALGDLEKLLGRSPKAPSPGPLEPHPVTFQTEQSAYEAAVRQAKAHIQAGDIFQANLTLRFETATALQPWELYRQLQHINPSPFASYWQTPWGCVVSGSPERLVQRQGSIGQTRPIAGTRPRGQTPADDLRKAEELLSNRKEQAEHIMLVDLERNDLGRVCTWGSVEVDELLTIERYSHVMHLVSNVRGTLQPGCDSVDLIRALFPGGTITGCPKVRCMDIIETLEPVRRSLFYGSCGYLDQRGNLDLNILIRTLLTAPLADSNLQRVWGQVGAGIVADSNPTLEWQESLQKAQAQLAALGLVPAQVALGH